MRKRSTYIFLCTTILLSFFYYSNTLNLIAEHHFDNFDVFDETMITSKMKLTYEHGLFTKAAFNGIFIDSPANPFERIPYQIEMFNSTETSLPHRFEPYLSQPGGQSTIYYFLTSWMPGSYATKMSIIKYFNCFVLASIFSLILLWVRKEFGIAAAFTTFLIMACSPILTVFGKSPWWVIWSFYVPFVALLYTQKKYVRSYRLIGVTFIAVLFKIFLNGFEFITPVLVSAFIPVTYYAIAEKWSFFTWARNSFKVGTGIVLSIGTGLLLLAWQIGTLTNKFADGIEHITYSFLKRSHGNPEEIEAVYGDSLRSSISETVSKYLEMPALNFDTVHLPVTYLLLLKIWAILTVFLLVVKPTRKTIALISIQLLGIASFMSWFIVFKGHAFIHIHIDEIIFYFPFLILACISLGFSFSRIVQLIKRQ